MKIKYILIKDLIINRFINIEVERLSRYKFRFYNFSFYIIKL